MALSIMREVEVDDFSTIEGWAQEDVGYLTKAIRLISEYFPASSW